MDDIQAMTYGLERLLRPKSIAAIGGLQASRVVEQCRLMGYEGEIWPVPLWWCLHSLQNHVNL